ncbi:hypothetical protein [Winogradskyella jejuensis]|uniref:TonB-dependent Receptor Plug Domain n=1 Tax=Winogradskyella jejuensis TaxID=1089305 RepID=A0A1M5MAJ3_9FLAO|nr:hypothetical protein [Winogradskyella jejuensis]SHG74276.1 hypothetical protein SAMN05444148_0847 [Winogradskyella jejuensis]
MSKTTLSKNSIYSFLLIFFIYGISASAQSSDIVDAYETYTEAPREIAYVHLNKSTYIEGEIMGFQAYVFDKFTKEPSKMTNNLYCTISDANGKVIKKKLIKVDNGISKNAFDIDSTLSTGVFTFKAYTNWMRNFEEQNHFEQTFKVIDADNLDSVKPIETKDIKIDLQVLGEGGHIIYGLSNSVGILAKTQFGNGIANAYGTITDSNNNIISEFQLNEVGLAKALLSPQENENYKVNLFAGKQNISVPINEIKKIGITLSLVSSKDKVSIKLTANDKTKSIIKNNDFNIALHNGSEMKLTPFNFNNDGVAILIFPKVDLYKGINIFTIFNNENIPLLERLYFNANQIKSIEISSVKVSTIRDSLSVTISSENLKNNLNSNLSISVLPTETKSYNHHNSILSQIYIQPYINGFLENGRAYFKNRNRKTEYNLDLLMLTQGWSSYCWNTIFDKNEREYIYPFERGIDIVANINDDKIGSYIVYPLAKNSTQLFDINASEKEFTIKQSFPTEDDLFRIGYIDTKKKKIGKKPSIYLQYYPSQFPDFNIASNTIEETYSIEETYLKNETNLNAFDINNATKLDEVIINSKANSIETKVEKLQQKATTAKFRVIEDNVKLTGMRVDTYIQRLGGYDTYYDIFSGRLSIVNTRIRWTDPTPLVYLNSSLLTTTGRKSDFGILTFITMDQVDYIEYEPYGIGGGIRGAAGYIKIFLTPGGPPIKKPNNIVDYKLPLLFSKNKTFYSPKYFYYNTDFFKEYGTIDWKPNISLDKNGKANFKLYNTKTKMISLFIEGIINDNQYISQELKIEIPD